MLVDRTAAATGVEPRRRRLLPVAALLVLAPWAAECSWGGFTASGFLFVVVLLAPMYGGAAVLIRETARHTGGGWPAIVLLAAAFGVFQAGLVDQALFNRAYLDDTEFRDWAATSARTLVPWLGFSAEQAFDYIGNHVALSICAPIAIVESFLAPPRRHRPWLGGRGLAVVGILYILGSLLIFLDDSGRKNFMASPPQWTFGALVVLALIGAALLPRWHRPPRPRSGPVPRWYWVGLLVLGAHLGGWFVSGWPGVGVRVAAVVVTVAAIVVWSRREGWGQRHVLAAWSAGLVAAAAGAYVVPNYAPASPLAALIGDVCISVIALALIGGAFWRLRGAPSVRPRRAPAEPPARGC
ncbi:MAG: hypothetical protein V7603_267 [Micromonosporaceae bacterium]